MRKFSLFLMGAMLVGVAALWISVTPTPAPTPTPTPNPNLTPTPSPSGNTITLDPSVKHQTMSGWEAGGGIDGGPHSMTYSKLMSRLSQYKDKLYADAVDLGLNRVSVPVWANFEGPDYTTRWPQYLADQITFEGTYKYPHSIVSSNPDPNVLNLNGFDFDDLDFQVANVIVPLKQLVEARGERFYFIGNYDAAWINGSYLHTSDPRFYARFVLATFTHLKQKYGFVPDVWVMCNEPDNFVSNGWNPTFMGNALVQTAAVLHANGFSPRFNLPAPTDISHAMFWINGVLSVSGNAPLISEFSYHYYFGHTDAQLQQIAALATQHHFDTGMNESAGYNGTTVAFLHDDLKWANNSSWDGPGLEQLPNYAPNNDGYFAIDANNGVSPQTNTINYRQYFHYIRSGAVRIDASSNNNSLDPLGFINANGKYVVVIQAATSANFSVSKLPAGTYGIEYTAGGQFNHDVADYNVTNGTLTTQIPGQGVITIYGK